MQLPTIAFSEYVPMYAVMIAPHYLILPDDDESDKAWTVSVYINFPCRESNKPFEKRSPASVKDELAIGSVGPFELVVPGKAFQVTDIFGREVVLSRAL